MIFLFDLDENLCPKPSAFWLLGGVIVTLLVPLLVYQCVKYFRMRNAHNMNGKVVLITGASSGLGEALAHEFHKLGCRVILSSRNEDQLKKVRDMIIEEHRNIKNVKTFPPVVLPLDLSEIDTLSRRADAALALYGQIDILVNNGGVSYRGDIVTTDMDVDMRLMMINYFGHVALTKAILPSMIARKEGRILFVSSVQGLIGIPNRSAYVASKHALQGFCDSLRSEVAAQNIKITVLSPGHMKTKLSENAVTGNGKVYGVMDKATANGLEPSKVANMTVKALIQGKKEIVVATVSPKVAIFIRYFLPPIFFSVMERRAKNAECNFPDLKGSKSLQHFIHTLNGP